MSKERQAAANYIADLSAELAKVARRHGLDTTAYMLEIAAADAGAQPGAGNGARRLGRPDHRPGVH